MLNYLLSKGCEVILWRVAEVLIIEVEGVGVKKFNDLRF